MQLDTQELGVLAEMLAAQKMEQLEKELQRERDEKCDWKARCDNAVYRLPCGRWQQAGAPQRVMKLLGRLRSELKL